MKHQNEVLAKQTESNSDIFSQIPTLNNFYNDSLMFDTISQNNINQQVLMSPMQDQLSSQFSPHLQYYNEFPQETNEFNNNELHYDPSQSYSLVMTSPAGLSIENKNKKPELIEDTPSQFTLGGMDLSGLSTAEIKRQIHIQSEQKRRAQIRDGFEEVRLLLPSFNTTKQPSKAAILSRTVVHMRHLAATQNALLMEVERLRMENNQMKYPLSTPPQDPKSLQSMYSFGL